MLADDLFELGIIARPHGLDGGLAIALDTDEPKAYSKTKNLFIQVKGQALPYKVSSWRNATKRALVHLEGVDSFEKAELLKGCKVFLPTASLPQLKGGSRFYYHETIGATVVDAQNGTLGKIACFYTMPTQDLLGMEYQGVEVLIPVTDAIVTRIDRAANELHTKLPTGLIEVYLEQNSAPQDNED